MECFAALNVELFANFRTNIKIFLLGGRLCTPHQMQAFQPIFFKFPNFLDLRPSATGEATCTFTFTFW